MCSSDLERGELPTLYLGDDDLEVDQARGERERTSAEDPPPQVRESAVRCGTIGGKTSHPREGASARRAVDRVRSCDETVHRPRDGDVGASSWIGQGIQLACSTARAIWGDCSEFVPHGTDEIAFEPPHRVTGARRGLSFKMARASSFESWRCGRTAEAKIGRAHV